MWFQLRVINRILGTNHYLNKIGASSSSLCRKCDNAPETLMHIFIECPVTVTLWDNIKKYVREKINYHSKLTNMDIKLGYLLSDQNRTPINILLILTKEYIFDSFKNNTVMCLDRLMHKFKRIYAEEKLLAKLKDKEDFFDLKWKNWKLVLE